jgi:hypothetical protein
MAESRYEGELTGWVTGCRGTWLERAWRWKVVGLRCWRFIAWSLPTGSRDRVVGRAQVEKTSDEPDDERHETVGENQVAGG